MEPWTLMAMATSPKSSGGADGGAAAGPMSGFMSLLPLVLIFVLFYVLFIMPQRKQQKRQQELLKALRKGDEVLTTGGVFGTIHGFNERENTVYLKLGENMKIEIQRSAISGLRKSPAAEQNPSLPVKK